MTNQPNDCFTDRGPVGMFSTREEDFCFFVPVKSDLSYTPSPVLCARTSFLRKKKRPENEIGFLLPSSSEDKRRRGAIFLSPLPHTFSLYDL